MLTCGPPALTRPAVLVWREIKFAPLCPANAQFFD